MSEIRAHRDGALKYLRVARLSLQTAITYRANVLFGMILYALILYVFFSLWRTIYSGGNMEGLTLTQMIWYLCMTELITIGMRPAIHRQIPEDVKSGAIAYQLNRPYRYIKYQYANALGGIAVNMSLYTLLALAIGFLFAGPIEGFDPRTLPLGILSMLLGVNMNFFFLMAVGLTAFFIEESFGVYLIYSKLVFMLGTFLPVELLPGWLQNIARALPFSYVTWAPARLIVAFDWDFFLRAAPVQLFYLSLAVGLCVLLYRTGVKRLQAHGG